MSFSMLDHKRFSHFTPQLSATADGQGTGHACYVRDGNVFHVQASTTGEVRDESLGNVESCRLLTDSDGKVHAILRIGSVINHAVYE